MKIFVKNQEINLIQPTDYLATGGEGTLWKKYDTVYKITNNKTIPHKKLQELSVLKHSNIIIPEEFIYNDKGVEIGYTSRFVKGNELCCLFTRTFKDRENISHDDIISSIYQFRETVDFIHSKNILIVDLNELNFLYNKHKKEVNFIDTNSYQTKSFPATAIMDSIRDWTNPKFTTLSDWYSWGIVTFQMICNIHCYKGKHSKYTGPLLENMKRRSLDHVSVFNKDVSVPPAAESFDSIPLGLKNWYYDIFEKGERKEPPKDFDKVVKTTQVSISSETLNIEDQYFDNGKILSIHWNNGLIVRTQNGTYVGSNKYDYCDNLIVGPEPTFISGNRVYSTKFNKTIEIKYNHLIVVDNKIHLTTDDSVVECTLPALSYKKIENILGNSAKTKDGCVLQNIMGKWYLGSVYLAELKGNIVDAKLRNNILFVISKENNLTHSYIFFLSSTSYTAQAEEFDEINFTIHNGMLVAVLNNGLLLQKSGKSKLIVNHGLKDLRIESCGGDLYGFNKKLYKLKVK